MKLKSVTIEGMRNIKDATTYEIGDMMYFIGCNGSGKSTILDAIHLALYGNITGQKKTNAAIFQNCNGNYMTVKCVLEDSGSPVSISRTWTAVKGSISADVKIEPEGYDWEAAIQSVESPVQDFNSFISMSNNDIKRWFLQFMPQPAVIDWKEKFSASSVLAETPTGDPAGDELIQELLREYDEIHTDGDEVADMNKVCKSVKSAYVAVKTQLDATFNTLLLDDTTLPAGITQEHVLAERDKLQLQLSQIGARDAIRRSNEQINAQLSTLPPLEELDERMESARAERDEVAYLLDTADDKMHDLNAKHSDLQVQLARLSDILSSEGRCPYMEDHCEHVASKYQDAVDKREELMSAISEIDNTLKEVNTDRKHLQQRLQELNTIRIDAITKKDRYAYLKSQLVAEPLIDGSEKSKEDVEAELAQYSEYMRILTTKCALDAKRKSIAQERVMYENKIAQLDIWIKLTDVNSELQKSQMQGPLELLSDTLSKHLDKLMPGTLLAFNTSGKANMFSFGVMKGPKYVPYSSLSSGEKCRFMLALLISIVEFSESKLKLIMIDDSFDHMDETGLNDCLAYLVSISSDIQFVLASTKAYEGNDECIRSTHVDVSNI